MENMKKVLIVEDSPTQALQLQMILENKGYNVSHGINGKEALSLIDGKYFPDIIISDIVMPEMNGYDFCKAIKSNSETVDIPVILLTHLSDPQDVIKGLQAGADNFISKPYSEEFLFERINDILLNKEIRKRSPSLDVAIEIFFGGQKYKLNSNRLQILDLLLSTYYNAINKNKELEDKNEELKKLHKELKKNNIQLKKLDEEKNHLLGIAAHDLRSPLSTIAGYIDIVEYSLPKNSIEDQSEIFKTLNMMLEYMLSLISDVLDFSKIASGKLEITKEEFNLVSFIDQSIMLNNILGAKKSIKVHSDYKMKQVTVEADQNKLKQVMDNLLSNAFKYSESNTNVHVDIEVDDTEVVVHVKDQGKGIPEKEIDGLFQPFKTTSVRSTAGETSTGLGLVSVKKIIETHGGKIWVDSTVGKGSVFSFSLPYVSEKDVVPENESGKLSTENNSKLKLLVVENEDFSDDFLSIVSFDISSEIFHASSGKEAIQQCLDNPDLDLILMDVELKEMTGIEAIYEIKKINKKVKIILQSSNSDSNVIEEMKKAGGDAFLLKPISKSDLLQKTEELFT
jgi:signal transduction histidine kinase